MYEIYIKKKVAKFIDTLENSSEIKNKLIELKNFKSDKKIHLDIVKLKPKSLNSYRLRIGEVRFIFDILEKENVIYIRLADYRGRVYK